MSFRLSVRCAIAAMFVLLVSGAALAQPIITDFTPKTGVAGTTVNIIGTGLDQAISVLFNGTPAAFTAIGSNLIIATAPRLVTTGPISTISFLPTVPTLASFTVPPPVISGFGPRQLAAGTVVEIAGTSFTDADSVAFGVSAIPSPSFTVVSDSLVRAVVPAGTSGGSIRLSTFGGGTTFSTPTFISIPGLVSNPWLDTDVAGWLIDRTAWVIPFDSLTGVWSPIDADARSGSGSIAMTNRSDHISLSAEQCMRVTAGTRYTIGGRLFVANGQPKTGIAQIGIGWHSGTACEPGLLASQFGDVTVGRRVGSWNSQFVNQAAPSGAQSASFFLATWPDSGGASNQWTVLFDNLFADVERAPSIGAFAPRRAVPGAVVTLTGNDFYGASSVQFNGVAAPSFDVTSATTIAVTVPPTATTGPISVTGPGGIGSSAAAFRVIGVPSISSVSPSGTYPGSFVVITGSDIDTVTSVSFNGVNAFFFIVSYIGDVLPPFVQATVPANATTGPLTVTNPRGSGSTPFRVLMAEGDLNGDSHADITMQDSTTRQVAVWQMNGATITLGAVVNTPALPFFVKTVADFNGDRKSDMALQDATTGNVALWLMNGATLVSGRIIGTPGPTWQLVGSGDTNGNGTADLVLQNPATGDVALWLTNPAGIVGGAVIGSPGPAYSVVGVGDFNGDGNEDILLQNTAGDIAEWQMNGLAISNAAVIGNPGPGWRVKGIGDVNNDGRADILLRNTATGEIAQWQMNGLTLVAGFNMGGPGTAWDLMGSADYNGDGFSDVLLRDGGGNLAVWLLNGPTIIGGAVAGSPGANYFPIVK